MTGDALEEIDALLAEAEVRNGASSNGIESAESLAICALKGLTLLAAQIDAVAARVEDKTNNVDENALDIGTELNKLRREIKRLVKAVGKSTE